MKARGGQGRNIGNNSKSSSDGEGGYHVCDPEPFYDGYISSEKSKDDLKPR